MKTVLNIVKELSSTSSRTEKLKILTENKSNQNLKIFFKLSLDPYINFFQTTLPRPLNHSVHRFSEELLFYTLNKITEDSTRHFIKYVLEEVSDMVTQEYIPLVNSILTKDPSCGVSTKTVLKVWPNLVREFPLMKSEESENLKTMSFPVFVEDKIDGTRAVLINRNGKISLHSSSGREFPNMNHIKKQFSDERYSGMVLDGELIKLNPDGTQVIRKISNGEANKALNGNLEESEEEKFVLIAFDYLNFTEFSGECLTDALVDRRKKLVDEFSDVPGIVIIPHVVANSSEEVFEHMKAAVDAGKEGVMVKSLNSPYEPKRSSYWTKLKKSFDADFRIKNLVNHTKKSGMIGSLECESEDGLITFSVGSGLTDDIRKDIFENPGKYLDKILTVTFHDLTQDTKGNFSLYLPRILEFREDKVEADSLNKILKITNYTPETP